MFQKLFSNSGKDKLRECHRLIILLRGIFSHRVLIKSFFSLKRNCIEFALKAKPVRRYIPKNRLQYKVWWLVTSQPFEYVIFILILINTVTLAMKFHGQPEAYTDALDILNMIFTAIFALEFVLKLAAFRFKVKHNFPSFSQHLNKN